MRALLRFDFRKEIDDIYYVLNAQKDISTHLHVSIIENIMHYCCICVAGSLFVVEERISKTVIRIHDEVDSKPLCDFMIRVIPTVVGKMRETLIDIDELHDDNYFFCIDHVYESGTISVHKFRGDYDDD